MSLVFSNFESKITMIIMNDLEMELASISLRNENWKYFIRTSTKTYYVSNMGRFASVIPVNFKRRKKHYSIKIISPYPNNKGYNIVRTNDNGETKFYQIHRVVLTTFNPTDKMESLQVNHIDGDKNNNKLENLEWCTCKENIEHAIRTGLSDFTKNVSMYSLNGEFIKTFSALTLAEKETGVLVVNISAACKGKVRQAGGYQWSYKEVPNIGKVRPKKVAEDLKTRYCKQIIALQDGEEVCRFNSVLEASNFINKPHANVNISACALGKRKSAYGYQWDYV